MSELRHDPIRGHWAIIAPQRGRRTPDVTHVSARRPESFCPFCPGNEQTLSQIIHERPAESPKDGEPTWQIRVVPNRVPALKVEEPLTRRGVGLFDRISGVGAHEIIIETPKHNVNFDELSADRLEHILATWRERMVDLTRDQRLRYMQIIKNHGELSGATVTHPHSQLIALPMVPPAIEGQLGRAVSHFSAKQRCLFCDVLDQELEAGDRVVTVNEDFVVLSAYAARSPFELLILPRKHEHDFKTGESQRLRQFALILKDILYRLRKGLGDPPFSFSLGSAPAGRKDGDPRRAPAMIEQAWHWHATLTPYPPVMAGLELGSDCFVNPTAPEEAAAFLKAIIPDTAG